MSQFLSPLKLPLKPTHLMHLTLRYVNKQIIYFWQTEKKNKNFTIMLSLELRNRCNLDYILKFSEAPFFEIKDLSYVRVPWLVYNSEKYLPQNHNSMNGARILSPNKRVVI